MPNTYTQLYIHFVFAVKYRQALIKPDWEEDLHKYITGIVQNNGHKLIAINNAIDHLHMFVGLNPKQSISDLMQVVKGDSSEFVNTKNFTKRKFQWQGGYGAFSNSHSQMNSVVKYILNQKEHHGIQTYHEEYLKILEEYGVDFNPEYTYEDLID